MSIYSNVTEEDLENLRKLANQQKNQRALKIKNRILKQTHDVKLAESLSPITKKLDEVNKSTQEFLSPIDKKLDTINESTRKVGEIIKENNTPKPDTLFEDTLSKMKDNIGFFNIDEKDNGEIFWNGFLVEKMGGNKLKINDKIFKTPKSIQKVLTETSNKPIKQLNDEDREVFNNILEILNFAKYKPISGEPKSGRYKQSKNIFKKHNLKGEGVKIIIPSNIIDIYKRLEVLLGLKLSGHTDTLTEASNLIDELYKRGEIQNKQQYRNALNKFSTP